MANPIRVRFAPSPTGRLHIGGARTTLFNYLYAQKYQGIFVLRIEDTDLARNEKVFEENIFECMEWMGIKPDEVYRQSDRLPLYKEYADKLAAAGLTYEQDGAIFFRMPTEDRPIIVHDLIRGDVEFHSKDFDDLVIYKKDGMPTFHFANVIDDLDMKISHVIRGEEHLSNTPKHILLFDALGETSPTYAHIPLILNEDRTKMSKRTGDTALSEYISQGYIREAIINFLVLLGWAPPANADGTPPSEFLTLDELIEKFDLSRVQKAGAVFNIKQLNHINHHYLARKSLDEYIELAEPFLGVMAGTAKQSPDLLRKALKLIQDRAETLSSIPSLIDYFFTLPDYDGKILVFRKSSPEQTAKGLDTALKVLEAIDASSWEEGKLKQILDEAMAAEGLMPGDLFWPVRVALSGNEASPSPTELLDALGQEESLKRIKLAIGKLAG